MPNRRPWTVWLLAPVLCAVAQARAVAQEDPTRDTFTDRVWQLINFVEAEHIDPPSWRELLVAGIEHLASVVDSELTDWSERIPDSEDPAAIRQLLADLHAAALSYGDPQEIANAMLAGISRRIPGGAITVDAETARVNDSLAGNRYVGVGVVLDFKQGRPKIMDTYFGGPAHRGGILPGDIVYEVDGVDTAGMDIARFLDYSRDEVGTELVYVVGQPGSAERRSTLLVRSVVPTETVVGTVRGDDEGWDYGLPSSSVAHVKLTGITASTAHELRRAIERIERTGLEGIALDLRGCRSTHMHATALVADLFLADAVLGASTTRERRTEYRAGAEALFDAAGLVVLVDGATRGTPEWLAAVLRAGGAALVGETTAGIPFLPSRVSIPGWPVEVSMATGWILDPGHPGTDEGGTTSDRPLNKVRPDLVVQDSARALERARELFEG